MRPSRRAALALTMLAAACERDAPPEAEPTDAAADDPREAASRPPATGPSSSVADVYGPLDGAPARDVAFWSHPALAFQSLVVTGSAGGLAAFDVETGDAVDGWSNAIDGSVGALSVAYLGAGPSARSVLVASGDGLVAVEIDAQTRAPAGPGASADLAATGVCLGPGDGDALAGFAVVDGGLVAFQVALADGPAIDVGDALKVEAAIVDCAIDPSDGGLFALAAAGDVLRAAANAPAAFETVATAPDGAPFPTAIDVILKRDAETGPARVFVAALESAPAAVRLYEISGEIDAGDVDLGAVRLSASFDHPAATAAAGFGVGFGNYGGVYRDGMVAIAADDEAGAGVRATPLNGFLDALAVDVAGPVDPRDVNPTPEDPFAIDAPARQP
ncbi:MAG: hypothetical protein ACFB00_11595 [Parvularculaceae bacterium]